MRTPNHSILITCEHAVNTIPPPVQLVFSSYTELLLTHRGYDIGAQGLAKNIASVYTLPFFETTVSRLLIDCNRSLHHQDCFSFISKTLDVSTREHIIEQYYLPYRTAVTEHIAAKIQNNHTVLHLSIHSFTPILNGKERQADIGLLYHASRSKEQALAMTWQKWLQAQAPSLRIRRNYPYQGRTDSLTQFCRQTFPKSSYLGFELECNQKHLLDAEDQNHMQQLMVDWVGFMIRSLKVTRTS